MKIAVTFPTHDETKAEFTISLVSMMMRAVTTLPHEFQVFRGVGPLPDVRNDLASAVLQWGADAQLTLDADQAFPEDTLHRLLAHEKPIVGANYPRRRPVGTPTAALNGRHLYTTKDSPPLQEVDSLGMGVCLIRTEIYRKLPEPWFTFEKSGKRHIGEDVGFCRDAKAAGFGVYVDHALSREVGHIGETVHFFD